MSAQPARATASTSEDSDHRSALREAARNTAWGGVGGVAGALGTFLTTFLVARALGASNAGLLYSAIAVATVASGILTLGADTGLVWSLARNRSTAGGRHVRALLRLASLPVIVASALGGLVIWFTAPVLSNWLGGGETLETALRVMVVAITLGPLEAVLAKGTRGLGDVRPVVLLHRAGVPLGRCLAIALVAVLGPPTVTNLALAWTAPIVLALVGSAVVIRRRAGAALDGSAPPAPTSRTLVGDFWRYALARGVATTGSLALTWTDVLLVAALASPTEAGIYAAASRFALAGKLAIEALQLGIAPQISVAHARGDHQRVGLLYDVTTQWGIVVCWPICVTIAGFAPLLLGVFGTEFRAGSTALVVIIVGVMVAVAVGNVGTVLLMTGNSVGYARVIWAALAVNVMVNLVAIPRLGIIGAAIAWAAGMAVENVGGLVLLARRGDLRLNGTGLVTTAAVTLAMTLVALVAARVMAGDDIGGLAIHVGLVAIGMAGLVTLFRDRLQLRALVNRSRGGHA